jgi:hypothetical protein
VTGIGVHIGARVAAEAASVKIVERNRLALSL